MADDPESGRWRDVLRRVRAEIARDNLDLVAAGVAFYWFLSIFPAIIAAVSIWGLLFDPSDVTRLMASLTETMPPAARDILGQQLTEVAGGTEQALGLGTVVGILVALWGALQGTKALMAGLNIAYDQEERRGFLELNGRALALLAALFVTGLIGTIGVIVLPAALAFLGLGSAAVALRVARWPILGLAMLAFLGIAYHVGPSRRGTPWTWASAGAVVATVLWLVGSGLFSLYVGRFSSYNATYGSIAGVVVLLLWLWVTAFAVLVGAEVNHEHERAEPAGRGVTARLTEEPSQA